MPVPRLFVIAMAALCLAAAPVTAAADSTKDPSLRVAELVRAIAAGEGATAARLLAASKNASSWTAWVDGEGIKALPPPVPAYAKPGPCTVAPKLTGTTSAPLAMPNKTEEGESKSVKLLPTLTLPLECAAASERQAPWPLVVFYSGFGVRGE